MRIKSNTVIRLFLISIICIVGLQVIIPIADEKYNGLRLIVSLLFIMCIYKGSNEPYMLNPYWLFAMTPLSLLMYSDKISSYYLRSLSLSTWTIAIINIAAFIGAISFCLNHTFTFRGSEIFAKAFMNDNKDYDYRFHAILLFIIGKFSDVTLLLTGITIPLTHFFIMCHFIAISMAIKAGYRKMAITFFGICLFLMLLTTFNKTNFLMLAMAVLVVIESEMESRKQKIKLLLIGVFAATLLVYIAFPLKDYLASGGDLSAFLQSDMNALSTYFSSRIEWHGPKQLRIPYMYFTTSWNNLQYAMETIKEHTYGLWFFKPITGYLQLEGNVSAYSALKPFRSAFNTFGYIAVQYVDFGLIGSTVSSLFLGFFVGKVYKRFVSCPEPFNTACYGLTASAVLEMFFSNHFFGHSYPFTIILVAWAYSKFVLRLRIRNS